MPSRHRSWAKNAQSLPFALACTAVLHPAAAQLPGEETQLKTQITSDPQAVTTAASSSSKSFDWTRKPEMARERALPQIASALRDTLFDAGSITNFKICFPPVKVKFKNDQPVQWTILLSVNAKNQYGGYTGNQGMAAVFYANKPVWVFSMGMPLTPRMLAGCERIPDAEIQQLVREL